MWLLRASWALFKMESCWLCWDLNWSVKCLEVTWWCFLITLNFFRAKFCVITASTGISTSQKKPELTLSCKVWSKLFCWLTYYQEIVKDARSGLTQILATESSLKMMKNAFYFPLKVLFVLKILEFLSWIFVHVKKELDMKDKVNCKIYDVTTWETNNCITHIN